jgi:hypothetical protein
MGGCSSGSGSAYPALPTMSAADTKVLSPAEQQQAINDLNAAKDKSQEQTGTVAAAPTATTSAKKPVKAQVPIQ